MHYAKYNKQAAGGILLHSDRGIDAPDTHEHSNADIDRSRTHLNYDLKDRGGLVAYAYYKERIDRIAAETKQRTGKSIRRDAVTLCSWAVTVPKDLSEDKQQEFFEGAYKWFAERYGEDNIVTAAVHMDETSPHMHLQFTPIIERDGVRRLCAKDMETPKTLRTVHQRLQEQLRQELGCEVNLLNGATDNGSQTVMQLKVNSLQEQLTAKEEQLADVDQKLTDRKQRLKEVSAQGKVAVADLKDVLDKKARASEIKRSVFDRETQTYHKNMLDATRAIGTEAQKDLTEAMQMKQEAVSIKLQAEQKEKEIEPLYQKAQAAYEQAEKERRIQAQLRLSMEQEIDKRAKEIAATQVDAMFKGVPTSRQKRLEQFCSSISFDDGSSVLDAFEQREQVLKKGRFKGR